jgi:hypothetical protein
MTTKPGMKHKKLKAAALTTKRQATKPRYVRTVEHLDEIVKDLERRVAVLEIGEKPC